MESSLDVWLHDEQGGYKEHEYNGCASIDEAFRITHWHLIDTFVYFSHHLVTVPPAQWIAVAHRHGTQVCAHCWCWCWCWCRCWCKLGVMLHRRGVVVLLTEAASKGTVLDGGRRNDHLTWYCTL